MLCRKSKRANGKAVLKFEFCLDIAPNKIRAMSIIIKHCQSSIALVHKFFNFMTLRKDQSV